jgi:hypothetical protein
MQANLIFDATDRLQQRRVGVNHPASGVGDTHVGLDGIQANLDLGHLVGHQARLGDVEAQAGLHGLEPVEHLAELVTPADVHVRLEVALGNLLERGDRALQRAADAAHQQPGQHKGKGRGDEHPDDGHRHRLAEGTPSADSGHPPAGADAPAACGRPRPPP